MTSWLATPPALARLPLGVASAQEGKQHDGEPRDMWVRVGYGAAASGRLFWIVGTLGIARTLGIAKVVGLLRAHATVTAGTATVDVGLIAILYAVFALTTVGVAQGAAQSATAVGIATGYSAAVIYARAIGVALVFTRHSVRGIEVIDVEVHRERKSRISGLARNPDGVKTGSVIKKQLMEVKVRNA